MTKKKFVKCADGIFELDTIEIETENGKTATHVVYDAQRVDDDGFIRNVRVVDLGYESAGEGMIRPTKTIEVSADIDRVKLRNGSYITESDK